MKQTEFIEFLGKLAQEDGKVSGVLPSLTMAQGILESGWGSSQLAVQAKNLFGMKKGSGWAGEIYEVRTQEFVENLGTGQVEEVTVTAEFRCYEDYAQSVADHSALFQSARYSKVLGERDYRKACTEVKLAGYATDPNYEVKLIALIELYQLYLYDSWEEEEEMVTRYQNVGDCPTWAQATVQRMVELGEISGTGQGLDLSEDMLRCFVITEHMLKRRDTE